MNKDFLRWHTKKARLSAIQNRPFFHEREIWFCHLGINVGYEQDGRGEEFLRPVIIFRKFNNYVFWAIPLTTTYKNTKYYFPFSFNEQEVSVAILSQIKLIDAQRLSHKIGVVQEEDFILMTKKIMVLLP